MSVHRVTRKNKVRTARTPKSIEVLLRQTAQKDYPVLENVNNPMIAPQDYDVRQSGRVLELHNRDLWIRPTDLSWHFPAPETKPRMEPRRSACAFWLAVSWLGQIKRTRTLHGSHISPGNEVIYIDPLNKGIHGDENNVCLSRTNTFATTATCPSDVTCDIWIPSLVCVTGMTFCVDFQWFLV